MDYLFDCWQTIAREVLADRRWIILLDYDGTLTPIVNKPEHAVLDGKTRELLRKLAEREGVVLGVVSGRPLDEVKKLVGLDGIYYSGNHGLEASGPGFSYVEPEIRGIEESVCDAFLKLCGSTKGFEGVLVEDKKFSVTLHYRMVAESLRGGLRDVFENTVEPYVKGGKFKVAENKMTLELVPVAGGKGGIVLKIIDTVTDGRRDQPVLYVGDDNTDEDAFKSLKELGVTVVVGLKESNAGYYVKDVDEVVRLLELMQNVE